MRVLERMRACDAAQFRARGREGAQTGAATSHPRVIGPTDRAIDRIAGNTRPTEATMRF